MHVKLLNRFMTHGPLWQSDESCGPFPHSHSQYICIKVYTQSEHSLAPLEPVNGPSPKHPSACSLGVTVYILILLTISEYLWIPINPLSPDQASDSDARNIYLDVPQTRQTQLSNSEFTIFYSSLLLDSLFLIPFFSFHRHSTTCPAHCTSSRFLKYVLLSFTTLPEFRLSSPTWDTQVMSLLLFLPFPIQSILQTSAQVSIWKYKICKFLIKLFDDQLTPWQDKRQTKHTHGLQDKVLEAQQGLKITGSSSFLSAPFPWYPMRIDWMHFPQLTVQLLLPVASSAWNIFSIFSSAPLEVNCSKKCEYCNTHRSREAGKGRGITRNILDKIGTFSLEPFQCWTTLSPWA